MSDKKLSVSAFIERGGNAPLKPLQCSAESVGNFLGELGAVEMPLKLAQSCVDLQKHCQSESWRTAHNAAYAGLGQALELAKQQQSSHQSTLESLHNSTLPSVANVKMVAEEHAFTELLRPVVEYLEDRSHSAFLRKLRTITPHAMQRKGDEAMSSAVQLQQPQALSSCNDPSCRVDHTVRSSLENTIKAQGVEDKAAARSKVGYWVAGVVTAVGIGAFLLDRVGKKDKKRSVREGRSWEDSVQRTALPQGREL